MRKVPIAALLLAGLFMFATAADMVTPPAQLDLEVNQALLQYDDDGPPSSFMKIGYPSNEVGWGVLFTPEDPESWYKLDEVHVDLCPPEFINSRCQERVRVFLPDGPGGAPGTEIYSEVYDVRLGQWWHYIVVDAEIWLQGSFYAFSVTHSGYDALYQWMDTTDNAPSGTQWQLTSGGFSQYVSPGCGDIRIRAVIERHDVGAAAIDEPTGQWDQGSFFTPRASLINYAEVAEFNVPVRLTICPKGSNTPEYDETIYVNFPPNNIPFTVEFPEGQASWAGGEYVVTVTTMLPYDWEPANDQASADMFVRVLDIENWSTEVGDDIPVGSVKTPICEVYNNGNTIVSFPVTCWITGTTYSSTKTVVNLHPGDWTLVSFDPWTAGPTGWHTCYTQAMLPGDMYPDNDISEQEFEVIENPNDVGAWRLISPAGPNLQTTSYYNLTFSIRNYGTATNSFYAEIWLTRPSARVDTHTIYVANLVGGSIRNVTFTRRNYPEVGRWDVKCFTKLGSDANRANDTGTGYFTMVAGRGWGQFLSTPGGLKLDKGSGLTADEVGNIYLLGGKKNGAVYKYGITDEPTTFTIPEDVNKKLGAGASIAAVSDKLYMLVANRTFLFEQLDPSTGEWTALAALPNGVSNKPAKAGATMTVAKGIIYALKGGNTSEFYAYNPATGEWTELAAVPSTGRQVKDGAALCNNGTRIYAFKGGSKEFYTYDIASNIWQRLADLPKKARAGAALSYLNGMLYGTIGGNNEFYTYDPIYGTWTQLENLPLEPDYRKTAAGASMATIGDMLVISKGRRAQAVYAYSPGETNDVLPEGNGVMSGKTAPVAERFTLSNPVQNSARIPVSGPSSIRLYNAAGTLVRSVTTSTPVELDLRNLANGAYVLRIATDNTTSTHHLVIQH